MFPGHGEEMRNFSAKVPAVMLTFMNDEGNHPSWEESPKAEAYIW